MDVLYLHLLELEILACFISLSDFIVSSHKMNCQFEMLVVLAACISSHALVSCIKEILSFVIYCCDF